AQYDYLTQRLYLLGALVSAAKDGVENESRQRVVIEMTDEPPESDAAERALLERWVRGVLEVVAQVVQPDADGLRNAPIHLIVWSQNEQHALLDALARHAERIFGATSLFDFVTQLAGFDSPVVTHLADETRRFKNYPLMLQTLQKIAQYLKFDWGEFKTTFGARMFDDGGVLEHGPDGPSEWYTRLPRFRSQIPLEYAYGAWRRLPDAKPGEKDRFQAFADVEPDALRDFEEWRLYAMEWIARDLRPNPDTTKTSFSVPDLASFSDHRPGLARALYEFIMVERHVGLAEWRTERNAEPEQRALAGVTLLGRYLEADQDAAAREVNRRHAELQAATEARLAELRQDNPEAKWGDLPKADKDALKWNAEGLAVRLRLTAEGTGLDLDELLVATSLRDGDRALLATRWMVDSRLPAAQQVERAATPKQLLMRG
ncbi:MAG TPA: hypothetical protein VFX03_02085, partial [Thermomicrobiales bacterium]|nr:hypothetical protein [Thermomicrobiales bacterium]